MTSLPCPAIHGRPFGRFDEITYLVENASALTPRKTILARQRRAALRRPTSAS
jgi:hypothetical protein